MRVCEKEIWRLDNQDYNLISKTFHSFPLVSVTLRAIKFSDKSFYIKK